MKSTKKRSSRYKHKQRCNTKRRHKGGMYRAARAASKTAKNVLGEVFGKTGPDRASKIADALNAAEKAVTAAEKGAPHFLHSARSKSFAVDSPRLHIGPMHIYNRNDADYTTPKKSHETKVPNLEQRTKNKQETPRTRVIRLGSIVAPTSQQPVPIATRLFHDDNVNDDE